MEGITRMKRIIGFLLLFFSIIQLNAQLGAIYYNGANSMGLLGLSNHKGSESIFTNPAGIAIGQSKYGAVLNYADQYGLGEINRIALGGRLKSGRSNFGIGLIHYGIPEYKEQSISISYARALFDNFRLAFQYNFNLLSVQELSGSGQSALNLGFQCDVNKSLMISGVVSNALKTSSGNYESPQQIQFGFTYTASEQVNLFIEAVKQAERPMTGIVGFSYSPIKSINFRSAIDLNKEEIGIGFFYNLSTYKIGTSYSSNQNLGGNFAITGLLDTP
jgi:hypothetical protein